MVQYIALHVPHLFVVLHSLLAVVSIRSQPGKNGMSNYRRYLLVTIYAEKTVFDFEVGTCALNVSYILPSLAVN